MCAMCCKIFLALAQAVLPPDNPDEQVSCGICFDGERAQRFARQTCLDFGCRFACLANLRYALHTSVRAARVALVQQICQTQILSGLLEELPEQRNHLWQRFRFAQCSQQSAQCPALVLQAPTV